MFTTGYVIRKGLNYDQIQVVNKLWVPMKDWYSASSLKYGIGDGSDVSAPTLSKYLRPYELTTTSLAYSGYKWLCHTI